MPSSLRVLPGDALALLPGLPDASVDTVLTDPPYGVNPDRPEHDGPGGMVGQIATGREVRGAYAYGGTHSRGYFNHDPRAYQAWSLRWLTEAARVLRPGGHLLAFGATRAAHRMTTAAEDAGLEVRDTIAWRHPGSMPRAKTMLRQVWEPVLLARKPLAGRTVAENVAAYGTGAINVPDCPVDGKWTPNLIEWPKAPKEEKPQVDGITHPSVKPLGLVRFLLRLSTPPGGTVLDPFAGSGTTGEAALLEGFSAVLIEDHLPYLPLIEYRRGRARLAEMLTAERAELQA